MSVLSLVPAKLLLFLNIPLSIHTLFYLGHRNGLATRIRTLAGPGAHGYPGTPAPLRKLYTGLPPLDRQLTALVSLFAEAIDGSRPGAMVQAIHFSGQFIAAGLILSIEGARRGNAGKAVTWTTAAGNFAQNISFAVTSPTYFFLHLLTAKSTSAAPTAAAVEVPADFAAALPLSIVLGYIVPSILMLLPAPHVVSYDMHQILCAAWQLFPLYIALAQLIARPVLRQLFPSLGTASASRAPLRGAYALGLILTGLSHLGTLTLTITHALFPGLFHRAFPSLQASFVPAAFWPADAVRIPTVGAGAHLLLQWDEICGSLATLTWAAAVLAGGMAATRRTSFTAVLAALSGIALAIALLGPCGAAVAMVWARDEMLFATAAGRERKRQ